MKLIILIGCLVLLASVALAVNIHVDHATQSTEIRSDFEHWMRNHGKIYSNFKEYVKRFENFKDNMEEIKRLNAVHNGHATFAANKYSDLSKDEFAQRFLMKDFQKVKSRRHDNVHRASKVVAHQKYYGDSSESIPTNLIIDWREHGLVTPVKDQGACGSCWAFSATEQIESAWIKAGYDVEILSEQQIVDCDTNDGGCGGGDPRTAFDYVIKAGGLTTNESYPYTAQNGQCMADIDPVVHIAGYTPACTPGNDTELAYSVMSEGPISICVDASSWMSYQSGIIKSDCSANLDHCVQIVGLDVDNTGSTVTPYYIIRNSWGTDWGISGYIYVEIGHDLCGVTQEATIVNI